MDNVEQTICQIIGEIVGVEGGKLNLLDSLHDSGLDSLDLHEVELMIEEEFEFTDDRFSVTLDHSIQMVADKVKLFIDG